MRLFLIRHPRPLVDPGRCYGRSDLPLLAPAEAAAALLRPQLPPGSPLLSSPLRRCRELAEALAPASRFDERLREMNFGDWEGRAWDDIPRAEIDAWAAAPLDFVPPGGESARAMAERVLACLHEALDSGLWRDDLVVVTHQGPLRVLAAETRGLPQSEWLTLHFDYATLTRVDFEPPLRPAIA